MKKSPLGNLNRRVLLMGDEGVVLYAVEKKKAVRVTSLPWSAENFRADLIAALGRGFKGQVVVLYDAVEQHYRKDKLPKVQAFDKQKVLKRKLKMAFPNFAITSALELKSKKKKGFSIQLKPGPQAQPEYLFAALPRSANVDRVTDALMSADVSVKGLGLLPVESVGLVDELADRAVAEIGGERSQWTVLVGHNETGGLRQVVTRNGQLALTRLTPVPETAADTGMSSEIIREFQATLSYIARFGYTPKDGLDVIIIADEGSHSAYQVANLPATNLCTLDLGQAVTLLGGTYTGQAALTYSDALYALWAAKKIKLDMPMKVDQIDRLSTPRKVVTGVTALGLVVALGGVGWLGYNYYNLTGTIAEIESKTTQKKAREREYAQEKAVFDAFEVPPPLVNGSVEIKRQLQMNSPTAHAYLEGIDVSLGGELKLERMEISHMPHKDSIDMLGGIVAPTPKQETGVAATPDEELKRGQVEISFEARFSSLINESQYSSFANQMVTTLKAKFPKYNVQLLTEFQEGEETEALFGTVVGNDFVSGGGAGADEGVDNSVIEVKMTGAPL